MNGSHLASLSGRVCLGGLLVPGAHSGGVPEWTIGHAWRACVPFGYRGFESHPLRHNRSGAQSLSLLALLLFDLFWFVGLVHLALIADAKLFFCLGLRFLRLFQRFVELL